MANPLYDTLFGRHETSDRPFLHLPGGTTLTYRAFLASAARYADALIQAGLTAGDRLAVQIEKSPDALAIYAACARTGIVFLPLNTAYTATEIDYFLGNSGAKLLLCGPANHAALAPVAAKAQARQETLAPDGTGTFADLARDQSGTTPIADRSEADLAALLYTSGTTGRSKGAMLSQRNLLSNARTLTDLWHFTESDTLLHALPIFHTHGLFVATNITLIAGGAMIFLPKFDTGAVLDALPKATAMMGVPTFYTRLLDAPRFDRALTQNMRLFVSGSAPLLAETHRTFEDRTGHRILERYGMTETNMNTSNPYEGDRRAGTVGLPLPDVELRVTDETGTPLSKGEIGTIEVRGPNVFQGYWQMPEKTAEEMREGGFFITGDLGRIDEDGYVTIVGRGKDLIISGGYNIYPSEVEAVLDAQPGIRESAIIGAPHPDLGEGTVAILVPEGDGQPDLEAIQTAIAKDLARFKQPRHYDIVPELPRNTMGKVQKAALRARYAEVFTPEG
ncbi:malonate--CoA ligase [Aestuariibius sp. 2305UL40-4]|uniref:malonate--CoA ligase n=1 Tax=Aestuariibius violaceus TaxID=3234132 RepID=UPI00345E3866